jgi:hypothetical protein
MEKCLLMLGDVSWENDALATLSGQSNSQLMKGY